MKNFNKIIKEYNHRLKPLSFDPKTGAYESEVEYLPDFGGVLDNLIQARDDLKEVVAEHSTDQKLRQIYKEVRNVLNKYRTHIRNNYPEEYRELTKITEEGSHMVTGTGEQHSTPKAFKRKKLK